MTHEQDVQVFAAATTALLDEHLAPQVVGEAGDEGVQLPRDLKDIESLFQGLRG